MCHEPQQTAAAIDKLEQALPQLRVVEEIAHGVVEENGVKLPQTFRLEYRRVPADDRRKRASLFAHERKSLIRILNGAVSAIADV